MKKLLCYGLFLLAFQSYSPAQIFKTLASFNGSNGSGPEFGSLMQGVNGNLYGTTGLASTVFEITPNGNLSTLYSFCAQPNCLDGVNPRAGLAQGANGNFYGTTEYGGANQVDIGGAGTAFEITPAGQLTTLYSFCSLANCSDGAYPLGGFLRGANGNFFGTTSGISTITVLSAGTLFEMTPDGKLTTLYSFCSQSNCSDGEYPSGTLAQAPNGNIYGTTSRGGVPYSYGTVFEITPEGTLRTLYNFCSQTNCADGELPYSGLVRAANGNFYGTTYGGGTNGGGTVFEITPTGKLTTLYNFCGGTACAGNLPYAGLVQATNGKLYGTTHGDGADGQGTVFEITPQGILSTLHTFCSQSNCSDGSMPLAGLVQATNGSLYGTTEFGGSNGSGQSSGTVFRLSVGLGPFVETRPTSSKVGTKTTILGNNLSDTTSVSFNGTAAAFNVISGSEISATVPVGATTGKVEVTTPTKTLQSNVAFGIMP